MRDSGEHVKVESWSAIAAAYRVRSRKHGLQFASETELAEICVHPEVHLGKHWRRCPASGCGAPLTPELATCPQCHAPIVHVRALPMRRQAGAAKTAARSRRQSAVIPMRVFLIHVRDPQFYALPAATRAKNGNIRVMGFPPIGIMSLSAVLKRAGHECVMFDQANPETPNDVIIEEIRRQRPALVGLSFLSTTSYPYAKILARQIRAADCRRAARVRRRVRHAQRTAVKRQCPEVDFVCRGDGEQLILDLVERLDDPGPWPA